MARFAQRLTLMKIRPEGFTGIDYSFLFRSGTQMSRLFDIFFISLECNRDDVVINEKEAEEKAVLFLQQDVPSWS
jgi:hypothetical protein